MLIFDTTNYANISITDYRGIDSAVDLLNAGELDYDAATCGYRVDSVARFVAAVEVNDFELDLDGLDVDIKTGTYPQHFPAAAIVKSAADYLNVEIF